MEKKEGHKLIIRKCRKNNIKKEQLEHLIFLVKLIEAATIELFLIIVVP